MNALNVLRVGSLMAASSVVVLMGCNPAPQPQPSPTPTPKSEIASAPAQTQDASSITPSKNDSGSHTYPQEQILTCTVSECWALGGKTEDGFFDIVQQLAVLSADHRHVNLPESEEAGKKVGEFIKAKAKADRGQLLYAVVDAAVREVGTPAK